MKVLKKYNQKTVRQSDHERMKKIGQNAIKERNPKNQHTFVTRSWWKLCIIRLWSKRGLSDILSTVARHGALKKTNITYLTSRRN